MTPEQILRAIQIVEIAASPRWTPETLYHAIRERQWRVMQYSQPTFVRGVSNIHIVSKWLDRWPGLHDVVIQLDLERREPNS